MSKQSEWMKGLLVAEELVKADGHEGASKYYHDYYGLAADVDFFIGFMSYLNYFKEVLSDEP